MRYFPAVAATAVLMLSGGAAVGQASADGSKIEWISGMDSKAVRAVYPIPAALKRLPGRATVRCMATPAGTVEACSVVSESPENEGFGAAAVLLVQKGRFRPGSATGEVQLDLEFSLPQGAEVAAPALLREPTGDQLYAAWPANARALGLEGSARLQCVIDVEGRASGCQVTSESRPGMDFGRAALSMARQYRFAPAIIDGKAAPIAMPVSVAFRCESRCEPLDVRELTRPLAVRVLWRKAPTAEDVAKAYPPEARAKGIDGKVILDCTMQSDGSLKGCLAKSESPVGQGFKQAAEQLAPLFQAPDLTNSAFKDAQVLLPVSFASGGAKAGRPEFIRTPSAAEFAQALPPEARAHKSVGRAELACTLSGAGRFDACRVDKEEPAGVGFGAAAMALQGAFAMSLWSADGLPTVGQTVRTPLVFEPDAGPAQKIAVIANPTWERIPAPKEMVAVYPARAARMEQGGRVDLNCVVTLNGSVIDCKIASETPLGFEFGAAALRLAPMFKMKPMMLDGRPVIPEGAMVRIPIRFELR